MYNGIQVLRFFAAFVVLIYHSFRTFNPGELYGFTKIATNNFSFGVDIFFVISGFVIYISFHKRPKKPFHFLIDRVIRIAPLYWVFTFIVAFMTLADPSITPSTGFEIHNFANSLFFIPSPNPAGGVMPILPVGWTLNYEVVFYSVFIACTIVNRKLIILNTSIILGFFCLVSHVGYAYEFYSLPNMLEFSLGMILGFLTLNTRILAYNGEKWPLLIIIPVICFMCSPLELNNFIIYGIPSFIMIAILIKVEKGIRIPKRISALGDYSYSLYLCHKPVLYFMVYLTHTYALDINILILISIISSIILSILTYNYIDKPLRIAFKNLISKRFHYI